MEKIKAIIKTQEFKNIIGFENLKGTIKSLDNVFYGAMAIASGMFLYWLHMVFGNWLFFLPIGYVLVAYLGRLIKLVVTFKPKMEEPIADVEEVIAPVVPKSSRGRKKA